MIAHLVISLIAGFTFAAISFLYFGVGLWAMVLWYVAGTWVGFSASVALVLLNAARRKPDRSDMHPEFG